jgi:hypothetical protein
MKKYLFIILGFLVLPLMAFAVQITVPSAPSSGYCLVSTSTGAYIASTTICGGNGGGGSGTINTGTVGQIPIYTAGTAISPAGSNANIYVGYGSGRVAATGANNISLGASSLTALTSGNSNACIGVDCLQGITSGTGNFGGGVNSAESLKTGSNDAFILDDTSSTSISNFMDFGDTIFVSDIPNGGGMSAPFTGLVGINTTTPATAFAVNGTTTLSGGGLVSLSNATSTFVGGIIATCFATSTGGNCITGGSGGGGGGGTQGPVSATLATSTSMNIDFLNYASTSATAYLTMGVGTANIAVSFTDYSSCLPGGNIVLYDMSRITASTIGSTTFPTIATTSWNGGIFPGTTVINGSTDAFKFTCMAPNYIVADYLGTYATSTYP